MTKQNRDAKVVGHCERDDKAGYELNAEMIEAGAGLLALYADGCLGPHLSRNVAEMIYRKMRETELRSYA
jgi:hypothetical protein